MLASSSRTVSQSKSGSSFSSTEAISSHQRNVSVSHPLSQTPVEIDPDELFTKHTVTEVRVIQRNLKNDAHAKQEELRQMVGERYRDLLQASTSIISIARSSKHVINALEETRTAILAQEKPSLHSKPTSARGNDAHIKLLLDVPEHLWRLMEKKKYFTAAWLFLLSRVVHRALIRDDGSDEETWNSQGIDVLDQFPLVQRQWEHVSSFRQQIIVRAKQSLQEYATSSEVGPPTIASVTVLKRNGQDICATLLTLHLLESQPLTEALALLFERRSKALEVLLSTTGVSTAQPSSPILSRRRARSPSNAGAGKTSTAARTIREVKESITVALDCICRTVKAVYEILEDKDAEEPLIRQVLGHIQNDKSVVSVSPELKLSTHDLLMSLPSSAHFLLLPQNLRSYKPYVDLDSSSTRVKQEVLRRKMEDWFEKSTKALRSATEKWLLEIKSVKNVWAIRVSSRTWINNFANLDQGRSTRLESIVDDVCRQRIIDLWNETLGDAKKSFEEQLSSLVSSFGQDKKITSDASPIHLLFKSPPLPATFVGGGTLDSSFQKYRAALTKQIQGRTPLLDDVLRDIEGSAQTIHYDLNQVLIKNGDIPDAVVQGLLEAYQPLSESLCTNVSGVLRSKAEHIAINTQSDLDAIVFVGHLADELATSSTFITHVSCNSKVASGFRSECTDIYNTTIERWREFIVSTNIARYRSSLRVVFVDKTCVSPSPNLLECLLSLANAISNLGITRDTARHLQLVDRTVRLFISHLLADDMDYEGLQGLHDVMLLKTVSGLFETQSSWGDIHPLLERWIAHIKEEISLRNMAIPSDAELAVRMSEYLTRTQILFAAILPRPSAASGLAGPSSSAFLPFGTPNLGRDIPAALDLVESPSRFGLLLVN
ncbi:hypothetical protein V5O48_002555 [Marasmius crinis-equi]|uniref:Conserved oligomeric Golgi complex subunit 1 n=1 Tax=Marasmius crinis-equi TaxID=585013 RepID=A0ABR3FW32_9AGAR